MTIKLGSLFDGIGVFPLAAARCGITPVWASEIEKAPISITKRHFPDMAHGFSEPESCLDTPSDAYNSSPPGCIFQPFYTPLTFSGLFATARKISCLSDLMELSDVLSNRSAPSMIMG